MPRRSSPRPPVSRAWPAQPARAVRPMAKPRVRLPSRAPRARAQARTWRICPSRREKCLRSVLAEARRRADEVAWSGGDVLVAAAGEGHRAVPLGGGVAAALAAVDRLEQRRAERPTVTADAHRTRGIRHTWWRILTTSGGFPT